MIKIKTTKVELVKEDMFSSENPVSSHVKIKKSNKKQLSGFLTQILKYSDSEANTIITVLTSLRIFTLKNLQSLSEDGWKLVFNQMPSQADEIREEIAKLDIDNSTPGSYQFRHECEELSDWHKVVRFLYYEAKMTEKLNETGYLNADALAKSFEQEARNKTYNMEKSLSDDLKRRFKSFTLQDKYSLKKNRGKFKTLSFHMFFETTV